MRGFRSHLHRVLPSAIESRCPWSFLCIQATPLRVLTLASPPSHILVFAEAGLWGNRGGFRPSGVSGPLILLFEMQWVSASLPTQDITSLLHTIYEVVDSSVNHSPTSSKTLRVKLTVAPDGSQSKKSILLNHPGEGLEHHPARGGQSAPSSWEGSLHWEEWWGVPGAFLRAVPWTGGS